MNRRLARLRAVQVLFQIDLTDAEWEQALDNTLEDDETADDYLLEVLQGTLQHITAIDETIKQHLENWTLDRVGNVDRAVLREGVQEMKYMDDIPLHVSVNEAVEISKAFGGEESGKFVNGVLSSILKSYES
ncbi:transcription antitermination factor NusB [Salibacterium lacus]|uniref:Transcription antitermination protein NusB n=1 Tax=Salibacterium lacus TaxID=1898109 RepID=A0ABW5SXA1_9BACI